MKLEDRCVVLGCERRRHTSPSGRVRYTRCFEHIRETLGAAFGLKRAA